MNKKFVFSTIAVFLFAAAALVFAYNLGNQIKLKSINNFKECQQAGYQVSESYPRQCHTPDGRNFTEPLPDNGVACTMEAKQCPDGSYVGRQAPDCQFAPCPKQ